jgi:hypothetical protein
VVCHRPSFVILQQLSAPVDVIERRIRKDVISFEVGITVVVECVAVRNLGVYPPDREVHLGQTPSGVVGLLPVDRDVAQLPAVCFDELFTTDEHAPRSAARVIDATLVRGKHLDQNADNVQWGIELPALLALGADGSCYGGCGTAFQLSVYLRPFVEPQTTSGKVGATIVILGNYLTRSTKVRFKGTVATFVLVSGSEITTTVPAGAVL